VITANLKQGLVLAQDTLLMVVGRGASDPDANSNVAKVMPMIQKSLVFSVDYLERSKN
jgi:sirohydrochlorin cobaltochelatase